MLWRGLSKLEISSVKNWSCFPEESQQQWDPASQPVNVCHFLTLWAGDLNPDSNSQPFDAESRCLGCCAPEWDGMVGKSAGSFVDCCVFFSPDHSVELRGEPADRAEDAQRWPHRGQTLTLQATGTGALFGQWLLMYSLGNRYWCTLWAVATDVLFRQ